MGNMPIIIAKIMLIGLFVGLIWSLFNLAMCFEPNEYAFCEEQGYDYVDWNKGSYLEYKDKDYGRVICSRYFVEGRETKDFNVTDTKWGFALVGVNEQ